MATNSRANATYLKTVPKQLHVTSRPATIRAGQLSLIMPNASTHGPPTSSAVPANHKAASTSIAQSNSAKHRLAHTEMRWMQVRPRFATAKNSIWGTHLVAGLGSQTRPHPALWILGLAGFEFSVNQSAVALLCRIAGQCVYKERLNSFRHDSPRPGTG